jgi:glycosyltransferase involved in cell wall biosynthesis
VTHSLLPAAPPSVPGTRVVLDVRPLQEPERTPITAEYLDLLLKALASEPAAGESFVILSRALRPDPTMELQRRGLPVAARRRLPPTSRVFRAAGLTLDSFLLRGAEIGTASAPVGTVFHTAGGAVPLASQLPVVATLLDLAPWDLPLTYAASPAARFGHRLRARVLRDAARVIVCSRATAESARRRLHLPAERISVVPLAVSEDFRVAGADVGRQAAVRQRLGLPPRYLAFAGRYDARKDLRTLFKALQRARGAADGSDHGPPLVVLALKDEQADDRTQLQRRLAASGMGELIQLAPPLNAADRAALIGGSLAFVYPSLSEATGLSALEALSLGVPVICSRAGALPEMVGSAGIVVEPRDAARLAAAIDALWAGGSLSDQLRRQAARRAAGAQRTWSDVARETRQVYAAAAHSGISR